MIQPIKANTLFDAMLLLVVIAPLPYCAGIFHFSVKMPVTFRENYRSPTRDLLPRSAAFFTS